MRKRIQKSMMFILIAILVPIYLIMSVGVYQRNLKILEGEIKQEASYIKRAVDLSGTEYLAQLDDVDQGTRVTLIASTGEVLYDSRNDGSTMENHKTRAEVQQALKNGTGEKIRMSDTVRKELYYYAVLLDDGNVLRVSKSMDSLMWTSLNILPVVIGIGIIGLVLAWFLAKWQTNRLMEPVIHLDLENPLDNVVYEEMTPLLEAMDKQNKEKEAVANMRKEFSANVSHELKTPLTSISGYAEIMMNGLVRPEDIPRFSETIYKEARRLLTLIEDIIKISKLDDESVELEKEDVDLFELTREIVSRLSLTAAQRNIHMELTGESVKIHGIRQILDTQSYEELVRKVRLLSFETLGRSRSKDISEVKKAAVKQIRDEYKAYVTKTLQAKLFTKEFANLLEDIRENKPAVEMMMTLAQDFYRRMDTEKRERNVIDFNDMEHMALNILVKKTENGMEYTKAADDLSAYYEEILIDEYQDSNMLQEVILTAVSKGKYNEADNNIYMVGDVKQSIYRFRLAMPQIFMAKKDSYTPYNRLHPAFPAAITLDKNFRSRAGVCAYVNQVFSLFMTRRVGELDYTQSEYLNPFDSTPPDSVPHAALHILDAVTGKDHVMDEPMAVARLIAKKVQSGETVQDGDSRRPLRYGDFAILMRSMRAHAGDYAQALQDLHIPVVCDNATGLFENGEIQLLLSYLQVIDNPMQDIPLLAVLSSPIYGATEDELAEIKLTAGYGRFYSAVFHPDNSCRSCCAALRKDLSFYKKLAVTMPVEAFIRRLIRDKSLFAYIRALGDGQQRQENVETFLSIAGRFDQNGGLGLASFLRYVDSMIRGDGKTDSAPVIVTDENAVKIMSVHHSKGLEFPVCILAGAGRKYNMQDLTGKMLLHPQLGLATKCHQEEGYFDYPTLPLEVLKRESRLAAMSENLRVLYVAMTRAKSQFISFASVRSLESRVKTLAAYMQQGKPLPHLCSKLLYDSDFLLMSALCHPDGGALREMATVEVPVHPADFALQVVFHTPETEAPVQTAERETAADPCIVEQIREKLDYTYPYAALSKVSGKRNASALDEAVFTGAYVARSVPAFLQPDGLTRPRRVQPCTPLCSIATTPPRAPI